MFAIPITIPVRTNESVMTLKASVEIDKIVVVKPLLDKRAQNGVECPLYALLPHSELLLEDGRKLLCCEEPAVINQYLDAYRQMEDWFTLTPAPAVEQKTGVVVPLFQGRPCAISEGSTPD